MHSHRISIDKSTFDAAHLFVDHHFASGDNKLSLFRAKSIADLLMPEGLYDVSARLNLIKLLRHLSSK